MKEGWEIKKLGEVASFKGGGTPSKTIERYYTGDIPWASVRDMKEFRLSETEFHITNEAVEKSATNILPKGTIVISTHVGLGKICILMQDTAINQDLKGVFLSERIHKIYFSYWYQSISQHIIDNGKGATVKGVTMDFVKSLEISFPPLPEQTHIVAELDLLNSIIEKKRQQLKELDALIQSIFYDMFGDPVTNEKGWEMVKLNDIASSQIGLTYKPNNVTDEGIIVLRSGNIQNNVLDFSDVVRVDCPIKNKNLVKSGDILMCSRNGSARLVGKVAKIRTLKEPMAYGAFMTIIRSQYQDYLFEFFKTEAFRHQLSSSQTATINQITVKMLNDIKLALPPLSLQQQFADRITAIEAQKQLIQQSLSETETLLQSRMDYYFA